jgi:hypothetical protein
MELDGVLEAGALVGVGVEIAEDDEGLAEHDAAGLVVVVHDVGLAGEVVGPEADLVVVPLLVAHLRSVEGGGAWGGSRGNAAPGPRAVRRGHPSGSWS